MYIGIITKISQGNINYGNALQTYALNFYLRKKAPESYKCNVQTIIFDPILTSTSYTLQGNRLKTKRIPARIFISKVEKKLKQIWANRNMDTIIRKRKQAFTDFVENNVSTSDRLIKWNEIAQMEYDTIIVGSDVVWQQTHYSIDRIPFLDFQTNKEIRRISYAASFGTDWIPEENIQDVKRCLLKFDSISVREKSSVQLLKNIGVKNVQHVLDPVFLLSKNDWENIYKMPETIKDIRETPYAFVYLLGADENYQKEINRLCLKENILIVNIPFAVGEKNDTDLSFGDVQLIDCSPQEFIWLIANAEYIFTDSFHAVAFSTIFQKRFLAVDRKIPILSNRILDFLKTINAQDKLMDLRKIHSLKTIVWNYSTISSRINEMVTTSQHFLKKALGE